jgi:hypothetical protein
MTCHGEIGELRERLEAAERQLSEARARIDHIGALSKKWRSAAGTNRFISLANRYLDALERCADEIDAALTESKR